MKKEINKKSTTKEVKLFGPNMSYTTIKEDSIEKIQP